MKPKIKLRLLLAGIVVFTLVCFQLAFKKTFQLRNKVVAQASNIRNQGNPAQQLAVLNRKNIYYDSILESHSFESNSTQNNLLMFLSRECDSNRVYIRDFNPQHVFAVDNQAEYHYQFTLRGGYTNLVRVIYALEQNGSFGQINHINMKLTREFRSKKEYLDAEILLRQIQ